MKKLFLMLLTGIGITFAAQAADIPADTNAQNNPVTIAEAMTMANNTPVIIVATVIQNLGNGQYSLKDSSGDVIVQIDNNDWMGVMAQPSDTIMIQGTIDAEGNENVEIDVESATVQQ